MVTYEIPKRKSITGSYWITTSQTALRKSCNCNWTIVGFWGGAAPIITLHYWIPQHSYAVKFPVTISENSSPNNKRSYFCPKWKSEQSQAKVRREQIKVIPVLLLGQRGGSDEFSQILPLRPCRCSTLHLWKHMLSMNFDMLVAAM